MTWERRTHKPEVPSSNLGPGTIRLISFAHGKPRAFFIKFLKNSEYNKYMNKGLIMLMSGVGGTIGGYLPVLLGVGGLSGWSILGGLIGGVVGIWAGIKLQDF